MSRVFRKIAGWGLISVPFVILFGIVLRMGLLRDVLAVLGAIVFISSCVFVGIYLTEG